ncbi:hypothetical protein [Herbaspirillum seropedicae]|uniref:hypothetical protein n=1 Tax=Herbaspirillum seropedicae TaxID=964 RepID=UPI003FCDB9AF
MSSLNASLAARLKETLQPFVSEILDHCLNVSRSDTIYNKFFRLPCLQHCNIPTNAAAASKQA